MRLSSKLACAAFLLVTSQAWAVGGDQVNFGLHSVLCNGAEQVFVSTKLTISEPSRIFLNARTQLDSFNVAFGTMSVLIDKLGQPVTQGIAGPANKLTDPQSYPVMSMGEYARDIADLQTLTLNAGVYFVTLLGQVRCDGEDTVDVEGLLGWLLVPTGPSVHS